MTFTEYLTNFLVFIMQDRPSNRLSHEDVLVALKAAADLVREDWVSKRQVHVETRLTAVERATIAAALRIDNPILRHSLGTTHERNYPRCLDHRSPAA